MKQFVVVGLGRFGSSVARTLYELGHDVLAIDVDPEKTQAMVNSVTHVVQADGTDDETLRTLGVRNFDVAIVAIGSDLQSSILATLTLKELGVGFVVAKALTELHGKVLKKVGADRIVYPERDMGARVAHSLVALNILDYVELSPDHSIVEVTAVGKLVGKTLRELDLRARYGVNVVAVKKDSGQVNLLPQAGDVICEGDVLVIIGRNDGIEKLEREEGVG